MLSIPRVVRLISPLLLLLPSLAAQAKVDGYECRTDKHFIKVTGIQEDSLLYQAWKDEESSKSKPDLQLSKGQRVIEGTGPCRYQTFIFKNGVYRYEVGELGCTDGSEPENAVGRLRVTKGEKPLSEQWCKGSRASPSEAKKDL